MSTVVRTRSRIVHSTSHGPRPLFHHSVLKRELQSGNRALLGQTYAKALRLGIDVKPRCQLVSPAKRDVLGQLESYGALRRHEVAVSEEVHAEHVGGHEETLGGIKTDLGPGYGNRRPD